MDSSDASHPLFVGGQISPQIAAALLGKLRSQMTTEQSENEQRRGDERELLEGSSETGRCAKGCLAAKRR
jgi:hypothetical protein